VDFGDLQNLIRVVITVVSFVIFLGIVAWAYSGRRSRAYEEAANLPFDDDEDLPSERNSTDATHTKRKAS
jgi:cytochrome c oxidase cbb3-type subunit 4